MIWYRSYLTIVKKMSTRKRTSLSAAQKRELCEVKKNDPSLSNVELARQYNIGKATVTDILKEKERWLAITTEQDDLKRFRGPKWPQLERALNIWAINIIKSHSLLKSYLLLILNFLNKIKQLLLLLGEEN